MTGRPLESSARRCGRTLVLIGVCLLAASAARATDPQRLAFLLEYVGMDYVNAVRDGAVVNEFEYGEVLRFTKDLVREYAARPGASRRVVAELQELEAMIVRRAPADDVWAQSRRVLPKLGRSVGGTATPAQAPNLANGQRLWEADCTICHGLTGAGDGAASADMDPPPTAFRGEYLERLAPQQIFNAVSLGVDGTAMPAFAGAYTEAQRWDVAFFVMTLRVEFAPKRPPPGWPRPTLDELAGSSNAELLARLKGAKPDATAEHVDYLRVNVASPAGAGGGDAGQTGLNLALQLQDAFANVADRVFPRVVGVASYVRDPTWTAEHLQRERGDGWMAANADLLRYPGFRRLKIGSGLLVDDDGIVVSCDHLLRDDSGAMAALVEIELQDEVRVLGAVVGAEPMLDLAILRLLAKPTSTPPPIELGDSNRLQAGHWLIALGDPPGPPRSFVTGLVASPPQRECYQLALSATRIQSSLEVPPTALGGPVVDITGQVMGISTRREGVEQDGSAVLPINLVLNLVEALKVARSNRSPWIGVSVLELPAARRRVDAVTAATLPRTGVYIDDVFDPSPAARAGVRPGDVLRTLGGHAVLSVGDFQMWMYVSGIGATVELEIVRAEQPMRLPVAIEERPESATAQ